MKTILKTFVAEKSIVSYDDPELVNDESVIKTKKGIVPYPKQKK
jgi:hypothetical protein